MGVNVIVVDGNLGQDPKINEYNGKKKAYFSICNHFLKDTAMWFPVVAWDKQAIFCENWLEKGKYVIVTGSLRQRTYKTEEGTEKSIMEIHASSINFANIKQDKPNAGGPEGDGVPF